MPVHVAAQPKSAAKKTTGSPSRRLPIGAEPVPGGGVLFRLWAPNCSKVHVVIEGGPTLALDREPDGYFAGLAPTAGAGTRYRFKLDDDDKLYPDPISRFQPEGVHGPSEVIDPSTFRWTDSNWRGRGAEGQVLYEMHIGTFTPEGTWAAAIERLPKLAEVGVTCLEVMPVAEFAGTFGWGYDGVDFFAPTRLYGRPDDFRRFVDAAHRLGLAVILDVVYNHFGPDGNYLERFGKDYFSDRTNDWGRAINFDGPNRGPVREFFLSNIRYWLTEFHLDGFRFDATQAIVDESPDEHILAAISRTAREVAAAAGREILLVNENEPQQTCIVRKPEQGGYGMDALWNDDFHHSAMVALTGHNEAYYSDHRGSPQEFVSAAKWGYLFQGQRYKWQKKRRGTTALDLPPTAFVTFIQNHDQIANSGRGLRVHQMTSPAQLRAVTALMLLMPQTPMLFQGQEFAASSTFHFFADHNPELAKLVRVGRAKEVSQFPSVATPAVQACLLNPDDRRAFERCKLRWQELDEPMHAQMYQFHKDVLRLRREDPTFRRVPTRGQVDGAVLGPDAFVLRYFGEGDEGDRLVIVNLGRDLDFSVAPEPLLAPPAGKGWSVIWSSEHPQYGGCGNAPPETEQEGWLLPGRCTLVLKPLPMEEARIESRIRKSEDDNSGAAENSDAA